MMVIMLINATGIIKKSERAHTTLISAIEPKKIIATPWRRRRIAFVGRGSKTVDLDNRAVLSAALRIDSVQRLILPRALRVDSDVIRSVNSTWASRDNVVLRHDMSCCAAMFLCSRLSKSQGDSAMLFHDMVQTRRCASNRWSERVRRRRLSRTVHTASCRWEHLESRLALATDLSIVGQDHNCGGVISRPLTSTVRTRLPKKIISKKALSAKTI